MFNCDLIKFVLSINVRSAIALSFSALIDDSKDAAVSPSRSYQSSASIKAID